LKKNPIFFRNKMFTISAVRDDLTLECKTNSFDVTEVCATMILYLRMYTGCTVLIQTPHICAMVAVAAEGRFAARWAMCGIPPETVAIVYSETQIIEWCANILTAFGSHTRRTGDYAEQTDCLYTPLVPEIVPQTPAGVV
jgi:hypothetical protein